MSDERERVMGEIREGICWCGRRVLERQEMPGRRTGENFEFTHKGHRYLASARYSTTTAIVPSEVFLNSAKIDSDHDLVARDAAVVISVALQYGVPLTDLAHALGRDPDGTASSPIGRLLDILLGKDK
jgi:hypothetical protein